MAKNKGQIYGGVFIILAGLSSLLGQTLGWHNIWFVYPIAMGVLMILAPWDGDTDQKRQRTRTAGMWVLAGGIISAIVTLTSLTWQIAGPLYMVAAGLIFLFNRTRRTEER